MYIPITQIHPVAYVGISVLVLSLGVTQMNAVNIDLGLVSKVVNITFSVEKTPEPTAISYHSWYWY
jgi:hypothetical protein